MIDLRKNKFKTDNRYLTHFTEESWGASLYIFTKDGKGLIRLSVESDPLYEDFVTLSDFSIEEDQRGSGIGKEMINDCFNYCKEQGFKKMTLGVEPDSWVEKWYEKLGFIKTGEDEYGMNLMRKYL